MAYDDVLASRLRTALGPSRRIEEKKMFGGLMFMVRGKMCVSVGKDRLMCRIDPAIHKTAVDRDGCRAVIMKGRQLRGYVHVDRDAVRTKRGLDYWIALALDYNRRALKRPR